MRQQKKNNNEVMNESESLAITHNWSFLIIGHISFF